MLTPATRLSPVRSAGWAIATIVGLAVGGFVPVATALVGTD